MQKFHVSKWFRTLALLSVAAISISGVQFLNSPTAEASTLDARNFNPGNIISDEAFHDNAAMSAAEVQTFLNQRLSKCLIGTPPYMPGALSPSGSGNIIASNCLKGFTQTTSSQPADAYCSSYVGERSESAAQIIAKVGRACGISQKVLLVMLEKEQSLLTDSWPVTRQYNYALGMNCPDSGPGNSANCDADSAGFALQLYLGARQLKVYKGNPSAFNYRPFQMNTIQWNPNPGCGTSQVYIENWATAALYIYTPYRPNQAALNAGWGTGDSCSSYGNRNFYLFYTSWFGSVAVAGQPQISAKHAQNQWLGDATSDYILHTVNGGGTARAYQNGAITWRKGSSFAYIVSGGFREYFASRDGLSGDLGWPTSDSTVKGDGPGRTQGFQGGAVSHTPALGFATVTGAIRSHYASAGFAYAGPLGWPVAEQICIASDRCSQQFEYGTISSAGNSATISVPAINSVANAEKSRLGSATGGALANMASGGGFVQGFTNGAIAWSKDSGAFVISGTIRTAFGTTGGIGGYLGWPTGPESCLPTGSCSQEFSGGIISVDSQGQPSVMSKEVMSAYQDLLAAGVDLGRSLGNTREVAGNPGGVVHPFENGALAGTLSQGVFAVMQPIRSRFNAAGGLGGPLGWPTNNALRSEANGGGLVQGFEGGAITSSASGTFILSGKMRARYATLGGLSGQLGWPSGDVVTYTLKDGGSVQPFQNGVLVHPTRATEPVLLDGEIRRVFGEAGGLSGTPGWPLADARPEAANGGGMVQGFQGAAITFSAEHGAFLVSGSVRSFYNAQGGLTGSLGWPTSAMTCSATECSQRFEGGTIVWNLQRQTGVVFPPTTKAQIDPDSTNNLLTQPQEPEQPTDRSNDSSTESE